MVLRMNRLRLQPSPNSNAKVPMLLSLQSSNMQLRAPSMATAAGTLAEGLTCVWCVSVWAAALLVIPWEPVRWARLVLAVSAVAVVVHEAVRHLDTGAER